MTRYAVAICLAIFCTTGTVSAEECPVSRYDALVIEARVADTDRQWDRSAELYRTMLGECRALIGESDLVKAYDALSVALLMQQNYTGAIDAARICIEKDEKYNGCLMTMAKAYDGLGDREMALDFARKAAAVEPSDDYSAAVAIYARDFLKKAEKR